MQVVIHTAIPNMMAPTDRNIRTRVIPHVISVGLLLSAFASCVTVRETVKKSMEILD